MRFFKMKHDLLNLDNIHQKKLKRMKKLLFNLAMSVLFISTTNAQYELAPTGFPGDDFSLEGAIEVFRNSNSVKDFEYRLNQRDVYVNNLDLDYDGRIDFIRVEERNFGDLHAVILQVPISRRETQDIAVIQIEKTGRRNAILQIIGDEDIYGDEVIVEPFDVNGYSSGRGGPSADFEFRHRAINVYYWAAVRNIFRYNYNYWRSPYSYSYYPNWWSPWDAYGWDVYNQRRRPYYRGCRVTNVFRVQRVNVVYRPFRTYSPRVRNRCEIVRNTPPQNRTRINSVNNRLGQGGSARTQSARTKPNQIERSKPVGKTEPRRTTARQTDRVSRSKPYSTTDSGVKRSKATRSTGSSSVSRTKPSRSSSSSVKRSQPSRSSSSSVKRSQPSRSSSSSVKRSQPSRSSSSSVKRSQPSRSSSSSVKRSQPSRSSSSSVKRSQPSRSSSSSVKRSQPSRSSSSKSSSSRKRGN